MATEAQINANRENAKSSTGPKTEEGKAKSSRNNTKFGLFITDNCVPPEEQEEYEYFSSQLWTALVPADDIEQIAATEFIRNAWRLRRCGMAEQTLGEMVARFQAAQNQARGTDHPAADPMLYPTYLPVQTAIDRARTSAQNSLYRAKAALDKMQAPRKKAQPAPQAPALQDEPKSAPVPEPEKPAPTIRTQSEPVPEAKNEPSAAEFTDSRPIGDGPAPQKVA